METRDRGNRHPVRDYILDPWEPVYATLPARGELPQRAAEARDRLRHCTTCPRACQVDRMDGELGYCRTGRDALVSSAFPHHGEEDCLRGTHGSGTIFYSMCNLRCVFCQNADISQQLSGAMCGLRPLADMMLSLQGAGCHNINLVTPSHVVPQVVEGLCRAIERGLSLPVVYNTSAYDTVAALRLLEGLVDIYMPDFKYWTPASARRYSDAEDYPDVARAAIEEMHRQVGVLRFDERGNARRGVLARHLVMPGLGEETRAILRWLAECLSPDTFVNIMGQYRPAHRVLAEEPYPEIARRPKGSEMEAALAAAEDAGLWRFA